MDFISENKPRYASFDGSDMDDEQVEIIDVRGI